MGAGFLGLDLAAVEIEHRVSLAAVLAAHPQPLSGYTFASLLIWAPIFKYEFACIGQGGLLLSCVLGPRLERHLLQPVGAFPEEIQEAILRRGRELPYPLKIVSVCAEFLQRCPSFVREFDVVPSRDNANYIYATKDLAELAGRGYSKKRNLIAQAGRLYEWSLEALAPEHAAACLSVADDIAKKRSTESKVTLEHETQALERALRLLGPLSLEGLLLRVGGLPAAFSIFDRLSPTTAVVFFERALRSHKGLYQVINRETAQVIAKLGLEFINREEDLGDPGLRKAKLSYLPTRLEMAHTLTLRR
jgi:uncharacterized protein